MIHLIGNLAAFTAAGSALLFCLLYHLTARWWTSPEGRHLMWFTALLGLVFAFSSYRIAVAQVRPLPTGDEIARTAIFWLVALSLLWRLRLLYRAQIKPVFRRDDDGMATGLGLIALPADAPPLPPSPQVPEK